ncbi:MAG: acylphosphatase [Candidatus Omnitrophica bacterium]|nr:acylphosphatase [Candidatus Omnitrophota bacterium]
MKKSLKVIFSGRVQGVGFRYTAERIARHFEVTGYVKNLADGNVEVFAEGEEIVLQDFLKAVLEGPMKLYIRHTETQWSDFTGQFQTFGIGF